MSGWSDVPWWSASLLYSHLHSMYLLYVPLLLSMLNSKWTEEFEHCLFSPHVILYAEWYQVIFLWYCLIDCSKTFTLSFDIPNVHVHLCIKLFIFFFYDKWQFFLHVALEISSPKLKCTFLWLNCTKYGVLYHIWFRLLLTVLAYKWTVDLAIF